MNQKMIKVTLITLRNNEQFYVTTEEGSKIKQAKLDIANAGKISEPICIKSQSNRIIESSFIVDISDRYIDNPKYKNHEYASAGRSVDIKAPGYLKFTQMRTKLIQKVIIPNGENNNTRADSLA